MSEETPPYKVKSVHGRSIIYIMATTQEYGPHLKGLFSPLITGVGPVEAAMVATRCLADLESQNQLPDLVVSLGSAGSARLDQTDVYQASAISYRDMDASALGFEPGVTPFLDQPARISAPVTISGVPKATLATGASIVSGNEYDLIDADMVDMESYAIVRVCQEFGLPFLCLRGISDGTEAINQIADWTQYLHIIDEKLAACVKSLEAQVGDGLLRGIANIGDE